MIGKDDYHYDLLCKEITAYTICCVDPHCKRSDKILENHPIHGGMLRDCFSETAATKKMHKNGDSCLIGNIRKDDYHYDLLCKEITAYTICCVDPHCKRSGWIFDSPAMTCCVRRLLHTRYVVLIRTASVVTRSWRIIQCTEECCLIERSPLKISNDCLLGHVDILTINGPDVQHLSTFVI
ncbi:hypothetical protein BC833DRAFT_564655 [Globomyces pollinis-pini]|nr:hypothetical protein BC833DRAFT_564655 [Globomyces pollinis-pini]